MSLATPLCSGKAVSASRRLGGARVWACGDGERALGAHPFSSRVALFLPQTQTEAEPSDSVALLPPPLREHFYYAVRAPLGVLLADDDFLAAYARAGDRELSAVCVGAPASPDGTSFAWLPDGTVVLSVDAGTYAQLGVQAPHTPRFNARAGEVSSGRRFVSFNVRAPSFRAGRPLRDALVAALSPPRANALCFVLCCTDRAGRALDVAFPAGVARCRKMGLAAQRCFSSRTVLRPERAGIVAACGHTTTAAAAPADAAAEPPAKRPRRERRGKSGKRSGSKKRGDEAVEAQEQLLTWAGLCAACPSLVARDVMSLAAPTKLLGARALRVAEGAGCLVVADGFVPASSAQALHRHAAEAAAAADREEARWACVYAWGVHSAPVCWKRSEHEELLAQGENDVVAFVAPPAARSEDPSSKDRHEIAFLLTSAHDEFSGLD